MGAQGGTGYWVGGGRRDVMGPKSKGVLVKKEKSPRKKRRQGNKTWIKNNAAKSRKRKGGRQKRLKG